MARLSLLHNLPRLASTAAFLCLIVAQCECPDMVCSPEAAQSRWSARLPPSFEIRLKALRFTLPDSIYDVVPPRGHLSCSANLHHRDGRRSSRRRELWSLRLSDNGRRPDGPTASGRPC